MNINPIIDKINQEREGYADVCTNYFKKNKNDMLDYGERLELYYALGRINAYDNLKDWIVEEIDKQQITVENNDNCDYCGKSLVLNSGEDIFLEGWEKSLCCLECAVKYDLVNKWTKWFEENEE